MNVRPSRLVPLALLAALSLAAPAFAATPAELLAAYTAKAGKPADAERGQAFFNKNFGRDMGFSCASCHSANPARDGRDQVTEKKIRPLAPAANPARFTDLHKVDFNFDLNCKDVVGRVCTPGEKADVLAWLLTVKP